MLHQSATDKPITNPMLMFTQFKMEIQCYLMQLLPGNHSNQRKKQEHHLFIPYITYLIIPVIIPLLKL